MASFLTFVTLLQLHTNAAIIQTAYMKNQRYGLLCTGLIYFLLLAATPPTTVSRHIKINQYGNFRNNNKSGVTANPQSSYNAVNNTSNCIFTDNGQETRPPLLYSHTTVISQLNGALYFPKFKFRPHHAEEQTGIYPNPVAGTECTLTGYTAAAHILQLRILDIAGQVLRQERWQQAAGSYSKSISTGQLPKGVYWLQLSWGEKMQKIKLVKQ